MARGLGAALTLALVFMAGAGAGRAPVLTGTWLLMLAAGSGALLALWLALTNRRRLFFLILISRAFCDPLLDALKGDGDAGMGLGAVLNAAVIALAGVCLLGRPGKARGPLVGLWGAFLLCSLIGALLAPAFSAALRMFLVQVSYCAVFLLAFYLIRTPAEVGACLHALLLSSAVPVMYGLLELGLGLGLGESPAGSDQLRLKSTFSHANIFAFYLMLMVAVVLHLQKAGPVRPRRARRWCLWAYMALLLALLAGTGTRSAWAGCAVIFIAFGLVFQRRFLVYLLLAAPLILLAPGVSERLMDLTSNTDLSSSDSLNSYAWRVVLWKSGLGWMARSHYLFGYGLDSFRYYSPRFFPLEGKDVWDPHNVYVQLFFETGLAGLASYAWLFWRLFARLSRSHAQQPASSTILMACALAYLLVSYSDNMLYYLSFNWYFWFFMGTACAAQRWHRAAGVHHPGQPAGSPDAAQPPGPPLPSTTPGAAGARAIAPWPAHAAPGMPAQGAPS